MKILTNKTISSFLSRLSSEPISLAKKTQKIDIVIQFTNWLVDSKQLSPNDGIRFRNELYKKKRDLTPEKAPKQSFPLNYVGFSLAALSLLLVLGGIYIRFFRNTKTPFAYSTAPVQAGRNISFQGRLTDSLGNPISAPIDISYSFYTVSSGGTPITSSTRVCTASPDQDGVFSTLIGKDAGGSGGTACNVEIPNSIFTENTDVYLGVTVGGGSEMTPRQQIANVGYAINSETLQGMPPGQSVSNIPFINQNGDMLIAAANTGIRSTFASSTFTISSGLATTIQSGTGDITLTATNGGSLRFRTYSSPGNTLERMTIMPTTGRVGIGTAAPRALFDVAGDATVSGSLIAGGQIKIGEFSVPPTNLGNGSTYYDSNTNKIYYWNGTAWTDLANGASQFWQRTLGSIAPTNITDDVNVGAVATGSAMVHLPGLTNKDAWFNLGTGKVGIGDITPVSLFTVGNGDLFQVDSTGRIVALDGVAHTIDDISGNLTLTSNSNTISLNDNVTFAGTTTLNSQAYTWPGTITNGYILQTNGTGTLSWVDPIGLVGGANLWSLANGTLYPVNTTLDMFVGGTATTSAKFAFINSNSGTPTASISGTTANVRTFVDGNGNISTTNRTSLTLGNSATYNSTGNILLNPNGTGNVGVGTTNPSNPFQVYSLGVNSSSQIVPGAAAGSTDVSSGLWRVSTLFTGNNNQVLTIQGSRTQTTVGSAIDIPPTFAPTSGSVAWGAINLNPTINQTGGANGATRGLYINPTLTSAASFRGIEIANNAGYGIYQSGASANNYFAGNIGIGTTTPTAALDVTGNASLSGHLVLRGTTPNYIHVMNGTDLRISNSPGGDTGNVDRITMLANGNVGIGTTAPGSKLDVNGTIEQGTSLWTTSGVNTLYKSSVYGDSRTRSMYTQTFNDGSNNADVWQMFGGEMDSTYTIAAPQFKTWVGYPGFAMGKTNGGLMKFITYQSTGSNWNPSTPTDIMAFTGTGNVGIGTTTPTAKLDIVGNASASGNITVGQNSALRSQYGPLNLAYKSGLNTWTTGMILQDITGNVGIGTTNPNMLLQVGSGTISGNSTSGLIRTSTMNGSGSFRNWDFGADQTTSAYNFRITDVEGGITPLTIIYGTGNTGIGDTTPLSLFTVGNGDLFQVDSTGRIVALDGVAHTIDDVTGNLTLTSNSNTISLNDNVTFAGTTTLNSLAYTWPGTQATGYVLQTDGAGTLIWADPSVLTGGSNLWTSANGSLYPKNATLDLFVGGTASSSAKFAFINANAGTPTASISGTTANVRTFIDGNGNISTTNRTSLVLGNSTTYDSTGNILLNPNGTGNVGIGTANPGFMLDVGGRVNATRFVAPAGAVNDVSFMLGSGGTLGMYSPGTNIIGFSTAGVERFRIDAIGNATISGNLMAGGQLQIGRFGYSPTAAGTGSIYFNTVDAMPYYYSGTAWTPFSNGATNYWNILNGSIFPVNATLDAFIGGTASNSAKFAFLNVNAGTPTASISGTTANVRTFVDGNGNISTTNRTSLVLGNSATYNSTGNILLNPNGTGNVGVGLTSPTYKLDVSGDINLTGAIRTNGNAGLTGYVLTSSGGGLNTWTDVTSLTGGSNLWTLANGSIYPVNSTLDAFIGGSASVSAKFAFLNVSGGTPTASISGTTANVRTYLTGNGNLATTNMAPLTLGGLTTGSVQLSPKNTAGLFVNGSGNVGVGTISPGYKFQVHESASQVDLAITTNVNVGSANTTQLSFISDYDGTPASASIGQFNTADLRFSAVGNLVNPDMFIGAANGNVGINTSSPLATLDIRSVSGIVPVASISGNTSMSSLIVDQSGSGDIFTASSSGMPRLVITNNGNVGIGDTTPLAALTVGNNDLFQVDYAGRIVSIDGVGHTIDDLAGNLIITSNSNLINLNSNITFAGTTTLNSLTYTWPGTQTNGFVLQTNGAGTLTWVDPSTFAGLWSLANGSIYTSNNTVDAFIGGSASSSAKFAFLNVNAGTPTASISGTTANVRTFVDGNGNISTTNRTSLVLGNSATYNSTGNILLNPNGTGNVGVGTTNPQTLFHVQQVAQASTAEEVARFNVSDDAVAYFSLRNGSTTDALFSPQLRFRGSGSTTAGNIQAMITTDTGTSPALVLTSQLASSALATRPVLAIRNYTTDLMTIMPNGSVGISTTAPLAALDVRKTSGTTPVASVSGATSMSTLVVDQSGTGDIFTASSSGNPRFVVKNNGNVGIGYANPTYKLAVNGSMLGDILYDSTNPAYYVDPSGDSVFGGGLSLVGGFTGASASLSGSLTIGNTQMIKSEWGNLNFGYKDTMSTWATGMVLQDTTGNVGIGTINPQAKLHINSATNAQMMLETGTNANALFSIVEDGGASNNGAGFSLDGTNNIVSWQSILAGVGTNILSIPYSGTYANRIGINTTSPLASLDLRSMLGTIPVASVSGNTSMAAMIVDQSGTGDIFTASSSGEPRFVIKSNGNVGIGVANPTGKLSIAGSSSTISNISGDITFDSASGNISFSNDNLINVANIASVGQIQIGGFASAPTSIGNGAMYYDTTTNRVFYWDGSIWSEMGSKYWQRTLGSMAPQYITDAINLGHTATGSALVHLPGTNNQDAWFYLGTGAVGIGTRTPSNTYKLDVAGQIRADKYVDSASAAYYLDPAGSSVLGGLLTNQGDIAMIDGSPEITSWDGANYNQITIRGSGDTTSTSLCVDEGAGTACDGKINAGTIDPPYTINGKKYATYLPSMTGVKEETTGKVLVTDRNEEAKAYIKRIALGDQPEGSDLWLFGKTTNIKEQIKDMTILLSSNTNGKVWYTVDQNNLVLTLYSSIPSEISYRLTAPRFDAGKFANRRNDNDYGTGFILNDQGNILAGTAPTYSAPKINVQAGIYSLIGNFVEEFTAANQALFANLTAGIINTQKIVSPIAEVDTLTATNKIQSKEINSELIKASNIIETPRLNTNAIDIGTKSGELAKLVINGLHDTPVVTIDAEGSATFAGTLTAQAVNSGQLTTNDASVSGTLIANEIKSQTIDTLSSQIASTSSTLASSYESLSGDINSVQQELAALKNTPLPNPVYYQNLDASYNSITVTDTANIYKAHIADSLVVGSLFVQKNSILALESNLTISSLSTITLFDGSVVIAKNGNITSKGEISATSLAIKNTNGETVASIDASGSARFNEVIAKKFTLDSIATQGAIIADSGIMNETNTPIPAIKTNTEVAGIGTVPQDTKEVIIYNDNVTADSLIYLTPTSNNVQGQLSVSKKVTCPKNSTTPCSPYFIISSSLLIHAETPFNWLIIN